MFSPRYSQGVLGLKARVYFTCCTRKKALTSSLRSSAGM